MHGLSDNRLIHWQLMFLDQVQLGQKDTDSTGHNYFSSSQNVIPL